MTKLSLSASGHHQAFEYAFVAFSPSVYQNIGVVIIYLFFKFNNSKFSDLEIDRHYSVLLNIINVFRP